MLRSKARLCSLVLVLAMLLSALTVVPASASAKDASGIKSASGWFESAYAEWTPIADADGYNAYVSEGDSDIWTPIDSALVRQYSGYFRVDAVGLKAGSYRIKIVPTKGGAEITASAIMTETLTVSAYDRSGYAHFNYTEGVGAYNDDGTLKSNAIVLYVTDATKDTVSVTSKDGTTVTGIGNILNSVGADVGGGKNSKGGIANTNSDILRKLAQDGTPLVVRIIGNVTAPAGLTAYNSIDYGGSVGDNGFMARMSGGKDITIEGIGSDAVMNGWGLHFICQTADYAKGYGKSFEVRNIAFRNVPEDCVGMEGQQQDSPQVLTAPVERCWIHHCSFYAPVISNPAESDKDGGDGACDFKRGQYFTNSYCYYDGYHKTNLVGSSDSSMQYHITYHHNYWKNCESRGPLARQANIHMYNNVFENQSSYCMSLRASSYIFSEYNLFLKSKNVVDDKTGGVCKSYNNSFVSSSIGSGKLEIVSDKTQTVASDNKYANFDTSSTLSYIPSGNYDLQESISEMKAVVFAYAGTQKANIVTPDEVNTSVIPSSHYPTAAVVMDYSQSLNKTTVPSAGTHDNIVFKASKFNADSITLGGNATGCDIVFYVGTEVNITVTQLSGSSSDVILCNEDGESLLVGSGTVNNLPAGYYFLQSNNYDVGSGKYKEAKISGLTIKAVDPNAVITPIPTPPTDDNTGGNEGGDNTGSGDNTGDSTGGSGDSSVTTGTVITKDSEVHNFTKDGKTDTEGFFFISGNTSTSKGSVTFGGESLTTCLKMESSTNISFNASEDGTLVLVFGGTTNASGKGIKVDGKSYDIPASQILELAMSKGAHSVTKDDSINLFYMAYVPAKSEAPHEHSYKSEATYDPTCTEAGLTTYTCDCGKSYTETVDALGHSFESSVSDATCTESGLITYTCECGESYTEVIDALGHSFADGICSSCGEAEKTEAPDDNQPDLPDGDDNNDDTTGGDNNDDVTGGGNTDNAPEVPDAPTEEQPDDEGASGDVNDDGAKDDSSVDADTDTNDENLGFFARIWRAILDFFANLFGAKKDE